ncbi:MAG: DUF6573 family protein [Bacteroidota bacterium]
MHDFEIISAYSRRQAIEDGVLVDVSSVAKEAGFIIPVAVTAAVWADVNDIPKRFQGIQDIQGRLWDLLSMLRFAIRNNRDRSVINYAFTMHVGQGSLYTAKAVCSPGDNAEPVITIMQPHED